MRRSRQRLAFVVAGIAVALALAWCPVRGHAALGMKASLTVAGTTASSGGASSGGTTTPTGTSDSGGAAWG